MDIIVKAYAKINVGLNVLGLREDGFHDLDMVTLPIELHDSIEISELPIMFETYVTSDNYDLFTNEYNLASIAIRIAREKYGFFKQFRVHIHKRIPMSAGMAGGSADAAAVLLGVLKICKIKPTEEELLEMAKAIGADVPFCLFNKPCHVTGIGERLEFIDVKKQYYVLVVQPKEGLPTAKVFQKTGEEKKDPANIKGIIDALYEGNDELLLSSMGNGLEEPAFRCVPEIKSIKQQLLDYGFDIVQMTGSGSAVFALSDN